MKKIINWFPEDDPYIKKGEIKLHTDLHKIKYKNKDFTSRKDRIKHIKNAEKIIGNNIEGNVLDIGCGNGYSSVYFSKKRDCKMYAMECNPSAINLLIKQNFINNKIPENQYELILGSFNDIRLKNYFKWVISLGAIHHSQNLMKTIKSIFSALKPGGYFIAHEPYMDSYTPNDHYIKKEKKVKKVQGLIKIQESERDDHFFRECEYLTAFHHAGFIIKEFKQVKSGAIKNALIILQKPIESAQNIPHAWY
jgi:SAM-dependent methyltransferase